MFNFPVKLLKFRFVANNKFGPVTSHLGINKCLITDKIFISFFFPLKKCTKYSFYLLP